MYILQISSKWDALKKDYRGYHDLQKMSGCGSASDGRFPQSAWEAKVLVHPEIKKWRKADFVYYDAMLEIIGDNVPDYSAMLSTAQPEGVIHLEEEEDDESEVHAVDGSGGGAALGGAQRRLFDDKGANDGGEGEMADGNKDKDVEEVEALLRGEVPESGVVATTPRTVGSKERAAAPGKAKPVVVL